MKAKKLSPRRWLVRYAIRLLTKPLKGYEQKFPNDPRNLRRHIRKGDVLLIEGNQRISEVIKYLTQSSWSHSAIYIGDELCKRHPQDRATLIRQYGEDASHLLVEAIVQEGVVVAPLSKYLNFNIRLCRPCNLRKEDLQVVLDQVISHIGNRYDLKNITDLARLFFPVSLIPRRFRRQALQLGSGLTTRVICSSVIAAAFDKVGFPIIPRVTLPPPEQQISRNGLWAFLLRLWKKESLRFSGLYHRQPATLITPRDFDLSPYFTVVKFNVGEDKNFDYRRIHWAEEEPLNLP